MEEKEYFYFYKITNLINEKFYFGVHSTNNINDGYMGSGKCIKKAIKKYGISNFKKEILKYFDNYCDMFLYESFVITKEVVNDTNCYNIATGGKGGFNFSEEKMEEIRVKSRESKVRNNSYQKSAEKLKYYYTVLHPEKAKELSQIRKEKLYRMYKDNPQFKIDVYAKVSETLVKFWEVKDETYRKERGFKVKNSPKFKAGIDRLRIENLGYNNPEFKYRWKEIYEKDMIFICELLKYSNLTDKYIIKTIFNKNVTPNNLIEYYKHINLLPSTLYIENKSRFTNFDGGIKNSHKDGTTKKTIFSKEIKYNFKFLFIDFFEDLQKIVESFDDKAVSDSLLTQGRNYIKNFKTKLEYFEDIGIFTNKRIEKVLVDTHRKNGVFKKPAIKTVYDINFEENKYLLVDKELNIYELNENGRPIQKGKFKLSIDGVEYTF